MGPRCHRATMPIYQAIHSKREHLHCSSSSFTSPALPPLGSHNCSLPSLILLPFSCSQICRAHHRRRDAGSRASFRTEAFSRAAWSGDPSRLGLIPSFGDTLP